MAVLATWSRTPTCGPHARAPLDRRNQASRSQTTTSSARDADRNIYFPAATVRRLRIGSGAIQLSSQTSRAARSGSSAPVGFVCSCRGDHVNSAGVDALGGGLPSNPEPVARRSEGRPGPDDALTKLAPNRKHQWVSQAPGSELWWSQPSIHACTISGGQPCSACNTRASAQKRAVFSPSRRRRLFACWRVSRQTAHRPGQGSTSSEKRTCLSHSLGRDTDVHQRHGCCRPPSVSAAKGRFQYGCALGVCCGGGGWRGASGGI